MDRPDPQSALTEAAKILTVLETQLAKAQDLITRTRFNVTMATELAAQRNEVSFDQIVKAQIFGESMHDAFTRVIEARTHLDVASRALSMSEPETPRVTL